MTREQFHHIIYLLGTIALVVSLPLSHFAMGLVAFILLLNWIAEWNWKDKWQNLHAHKEFLVFSGLFVACLLGLIKTENWAFASHNVLSKLPLLMAPIVVATSRPFTHKEMRYILHAFITSTIFCCVCSTIYWATHTVGNIREISIFIDHIRFSLCIDLSISFCLFFLLKEETKSSWQVWTYIALIVGQIFYLLLAQTLTGIVILGALILFYLLYALFTMQKGRTRTILLTMAALAIVLGTAYTTDVCISYFKDKDKNITATQTAMGNDYEFNADTPLENGHRIGYYVCRPEMQSAWSLRSDTLYDEYLEQTLIRYLNSKGLHKDYAGVMALEEQDIRNVERHIANYDYTRPLGLRRALYPNFFSYSMFKHYHYIDNSTLLQRFELWQASWAVIKDNWFLGVGIGDFKTAMDEQLAAQNSPIAYKLNRGSHNQWLTYWLMGGILLALYFLFTLVYPFFKMRDRITMIYIALIIILFISALTEDTLETQTGRLLFCVFVPLLLHANLTPEKKSEEQGSASPEKSC